MISDLLYKEENMKETPYISVVIPTRDRPWLLRRAILSALRQDVKQLEVIVVLDGKDEVSESIISEMDEPRIRVIILEQRVGGAEARNIGVLEARGRYIALLDDDDEWLPGKLEKQLALADRCVAENFVVVTQYLYRTGAQPDEVWPGHLPRKGEPLSEFLFSSKGGFQTSTYLCPRELLLRIPFTKGLRKHQDWDWFLQLAAISNFRLLIVAEPLSVYWAALNTRTAISGNADWEFSRQWADSRLTFMTRKAYSRFIVKICVRGAIAQHAGLRALLQLLSDLIMRGHPTPKLLGEFFINIALPISVRCRLRTVAQNCEKAYASLRTS
jgi:glycosyltransferase involved in cell wall biosynthesis